MLGDPAVAILPQLDPSEFRIAPLPAQQVGLAQVELVLGIGLVRVGGRCDPTPTVRTE